MESKNAWETALVRGNFAVSYVLDEIFKYLTLHICVQTIIWLPLKLNEILSFPCINLQSCSAENYNNTLLTACGHITDWQVWICIMYWMFHSIYKNSVLNWWLICWIFMEVLKECIPLWPWERVDSFQVYNIRNTERKPSCNLLIVAAKLIITGVKYHYRCKLISPWAKWPPFHRQYFKVYFFVYEKSCILIEISLKTVPNGPIYYKPALVQIMAWHRIGDKPFSEPMLTWFTDEYVQR